MIQLLSNKFSKPIAFFLCVLFGGSSISLMAIPAKRATISLPRFPTAFAHTLSSTKPVFTPLLSPPAVAKKAPAAKPVMARPATARIEKPETGGPSQPEMSSFKSVNADNMVNLFTGDFSYNIALLDVGGYPVNLFYDGGISPEQESSWVGLGWNINPGTIVRNMRGLPDDFNGQDTMTQIQNMKPNRTWGVTLNADLELVGIKDVFGGAIDLSASLGVSFNNYLGPALDLGIKGGTSFTISGKAGSEKSAVSMGVGLGANVSSRNGLTLSPNVSLTASSFADVKGLSAGVRLGTSYNSRSGIKALQISEQMSYNYTTRKKTGEDENKKAVYKYGNSSLGATLASTSISFAKPSYVPSVRMPLENEAYSGHFQLGGAIFGTYGSVELEVYKQTSKPAFTEQKKPLVGYIYYQKANNNANAVMDFTRFNDNEVTPNTPIISAPQYSYDVFSIQGEGTGGSVRAYRNDMGYVRDNTTQSRDKSLSIGADVGIPGHYGANFNTIKTPTTISEWNLGNRIRKIIGFKEAAAGFENVYLRNPGENSVLNMNQFAKISGTDLVRFKLGGTGSAPTIEPVLERFSKTNNFLGNSPSLLSMPDQVQRKKRSQVTSFLTAEEAAKIGLDKEIKSYNAYDILDVNKNLRFTATTRVGGYRKKHHISQITVTESNGNQYIYGTPLYNTLQKDFTFTVNGAGNADDQVSISPSETTTLNTATGKDGFLQMSQTPPYAHSYLLTGFLSPDYVDVSGDGITEDDLGTAVKFNYTRYSDHKWRSPQTAAANTANFNSGNNTSTKDDKGMISYGERESWYLHSIESKNMIALFTLENRVDGKGPVNEYGGVNANDTSQKQLKKIDLYNKADLKKNGIAGAQPVKTVWFKYSAVLCNGSPDNGSGTGKLTLDSVYFTFNGKDRVDKNKYAFAYTNGGTGNPIYVPNAADRWGNYKRKLQNPGQLKNSEYPYTVQQKDTMDANAAAWQLKKILLPSGGQIEVTYESDDYAFVQNRRAATMMELAGMGFNASTITDKMYGVNPSTAAGFVEYDYIFIKVPVPCANATEVFQKYLDGVTQLAFKISVNMPAGPEYVNCYGTINSYGVYDATRIWVRLNLVNGLSPLTLAALDYLRERLPGQAFPGYDVSESAGLKQVGEMLAGMWDALKSAFKDPVKYLRSQGKAQTINTAISFVRLNDPDGIKYGGGHRVKTVRLKDNWQAMTGQYTSEYGQEYDYTTTEIFNGASRIISSGVASYEPSIGGEENPFQGIVTVTNKLPMGPASYGAIEMPVLDAFMPAPMVGYSKVTVRSLDKNIDPAKKTRSGIGRQVSEFYTAKDFPVYYNHTAIDPGSDKQEHQASLLAFFYKYAFDSRALSQGFIIALNDMHGKMKSQASYAHNDTTARVNYTENFYRNTGINGLDEKFDFVHARYNGAIEEGNMGVDIELMTDTREFSVKSSSLEVQGQVDLFPVIFPFWLPFIWPVGGNSEDTYRAVTTTKVINYHAVLDSVLVIDKGSQVSTKNLVYDAETGDVVVTRSNNEFDKPVYTVKYPAWWAYSGMSTAYKNIGAVFSSVNFHDGRIISNNVPDSLIESGDELYIINQGSGTPGCVPATQDVVNLLWAVDLNKNSTAMNVAVKDIIYVDDKGKLFTSSGVSFRIVRSGRRNLLQADAATLSCLGNPVAVINPNERKLVVNNASKVINATALEFDEKWQTDNDLFKRYSLVYNAVTCSYDTIINCNGFFEKAINPYRKGLIGNYRIKDNLVYHGDRTETDATVQTNLPENGFLANFFLYWDFDGNGNLGPGFQKSRWVSKELATKFNSKGLPLETKNAIDIYSSAQYGYQKFLPVAIGSNSRMSEMAYEGFEDLDYSESLNNATANSCARKHINITGVANTQIVNAHTAGFNAHSGKFVLGVNANSTATIPAKVQPTLDNYSLYTTPDTVKVLNNPGQQYASFVFGGPTPPYFPDYLVQHVDFGNLYYSSSIFDYMFGPVQYGGNLTSTNAWIRASFPFDQCNPSYLNSPGYSTQFIQVTQNQSFNISIVQTDVYVGTAPNSHQNYNHVKLLVYKAEDSTLVGAFLGPTTITKPPGNVMTTQGVTNHSISLCKGTYFIHFLVHQKRPNTDCFQSVTSTYSFSSALTSYASLSTQNGCAYTKPIPSSDSMTNAIFTVPPDKKMLFSAWVREQCGNPGSGIPCNSTSYTNNQVNLVFNDGSTTTVSMQPSGPIIEGWQRYFGEFTAPVGATQMNINLVNNTAGTIWFDDIRLHPYKANMKSYVYDPVNLRLVAELDGNNYANFYEYDEEGVLIRTKAETREGIKTITETRSFQQRTVKNLQ